MNCDEARPLLDAYADAELPPAERAALAEHLAHCADCGPEAAAIARLRAAIRAEASVYRAPPTLHRQIRAELRRETAGTPVWRGLGRLAYAASLLIAVAFGAGGAWWLAGERQESRVADAIIDSHLRSLLAQHLTDVASSDKHTVKPWFAGRTDLSPPGIDLKSEGFPLVGGRLDLVAGRPVPALVYRAGKHIINVFVLPAGPRDHAAIVKRRGYTLRHWKEGDLGYWAVTDAAPDEFDKFEAAFRRAAAG